MTVLWKLFLAVLAVSGQSSAEAEMDWDSMEERIAELQATVANLKSTYDTISTEIFTIASEHENGWTMKYRTCSEIKAREPTRPSGTYLLDPERTGESMEVYCNMEDVDAVTIIQHDKKNSSSRIDHCEGKGCFKELYSYNATESQLKRLTTLSSHCSQEIKFTCNKAPLKLSAFGAMQFGWWLDRDLRERYYFDGGQQEQQVCGCLKTETCAGSFFNVTCNCDVSGLINTQAEDLGKIIRKDHLPIRGFQYGNFITPDSWAAIQIGPLECRGNNQGVKEFVFVPEPKTWEDARAHCRSLGGDLANMKTQKDEEKIASISSGRIWLGANDLDEWGTWHWSDGTLVDFNSFNIWFNGEPTTEGDDYYEHCMEYKHNDVSIKGNDIPCDHDSTSPFFCKDLTSGTIQFISESKRWDTAKSYCEGMGQILAPMSSNEDITKMAQLYVGKFHVGGRRGADTNFEWLDGKPFEFTSWDDGEPNDYDDEEDCMEVSVKRSGWNDKRCTYDRPFVCQVE